MSTPQTTGRTTSAPPPPTIPESRTGTGATVAPATSFSPGTIVTPVTSFGFAWGSGLMSFLQGKPRVVSSALRSAIIADSNAAPKPLVKEAN